MKGYIHHAEDDFEVEAEVETAPRKPLPDERFWAIIRLIVLAMAIAGTLVAVKMLGTIALFIIGFGVFIGAIIYLCANSY